jgi:hypothetical protein
MSVPYVFMDVYNSKHEVRSDDAGNAARHREMAENLPDTDREAQEAADARIDTGMNEAKFMPAASSTTSTTSSNLFHHHHEIIHHDPGEDMDPFTGAETAARSIP